MIRTSFRTILLVMAGALSSQGVFAQMPGAPQHETIHRASSTPETSAISGMPSSSNPGTGTPAPIAAPAKKYASLLSRERETMGLVAGVHKDFYPDDEFLHILATPGRKALISAPFNSKMKSESAKSSIPGVGSSTSGRLYRTDSSITALVNWYSNEYGFDFKIARSPFSEGAPGDTLTVARAVKRMNNTIVTVMIWNPSSTAQGGKKSRKVSYGGKTSVEIQEMAFRPRGELIVEGPDAVVEFTWKVPYRDLIQKISVRYQLDPYLLAALVQQESGFNPNACSVDSAMGLTQMIPATAEALGVSNPNDPHQSIDGGARYLKMLLKRFKGNAEFALAGYNAGPGNVEKYHGIPPFSETRDYVKRIMARYKEKAGGKLATTAKLVNKS